MKQKRTSKKKVSSTNVAVASAEQLKSVITVADAEKENREHKAVCLLTCSTRMRLRKKIF